MDFEAVTPVQRRVVAELFDRDGRTSRPVYDPDIAVRLRDGLEAALGPVTDRLGPRELFVSKRSLADVLACETYHVASTRAGFGGWNPASARGSVVHKAIELLVHMPEAAPLEVVDDRAPVRRLRPRRACSSWT